MGAGDLGGMLPDGVLVIGAGLIGASIGLALRERGVTVWLRDRDDAAVRLAADLGAGVPWPGRGRADLAVLAVPPAAVPAALRDAQRQDVARCYTDVASVKAQPIAGGEALGCDMAAFVGGHPLGGRERSGPVAARADLFLGRPWVLCPTAVTKGDVTETAVAVARACGAEPLVTGADEHDRAVALTSHAAHAVSSAMAAQLLLADETALTLVGQGLRDVTRVAAGDPQLWTEILRGNAGPVAAVLEAVAHDVQHVARALRAMEAGPAGGGRTSPGADRTGSAPEERGGPQPAPGADPMEAVTALLRRGNTGRARMPGKRGGPAPAYALVPVVIQDRPGELARLFQAAGDAGINVEDVSIEHSPGLPVGVAELSVREGLAERLAQQLRARGWSVHR